MPFNVQARKRMNSINVNGQVYVRDKFNTVYLRVMHAEFNVSTYVVNCNN